MKRLIVAALLLALLSAEPSHAGIFGKKPVKPSPAERVPELVKILKTDGDERKRTDAADELRQYDPAAFPQIYPALIDALMSDPKPSVRAEAAQSLGKMRPVSPAVGPALELAREKDAAMRVRLQARSALLSYSWGGGYKGGKPADPPGSGKEPAVVDAKNSPAAVRPKEVPSPWPPPPPNGQESLLAPVPETPNRLAPRPQPMPSSRPVLKPTTQEPPLAPMPDTSARSVPRPMPIPTTPTITPSFKPMPQGSPRKAPQTTEPPLAPPAEQIPLAPSPVQAKPAPEQIQPRPPQLVPVAVPTPPVNGPVEQDGPDLGPPEMNGQ